MPTIVLLTMLVAANAFAWNKVIDVKKDTGESVLFKAALRAPNGALYVGNEIGQIYRSADVGKKWVKLFSDPTNGINVLAVDKRGTLYAGAAQTFETKGQVPLLISKNEGKKWAKVFPLPKKYFPSSISALAVNASTVVCGFEGGQVMISNDGGKKWWELDSIGGDEITAAYVDSTGNIYVSMAKQGNFRFPPRAKKGKKLAAMSAFSAKGTYPLSEVIAEDYLPLPEGDLLATAAYGVAKLVKNAPAWKHLGPKETFQSLAKEDRTGWVYAVTNDLEARLYVSKDKGKSFSTFKKQPTFQAHGPLLVTYTALILVGDGVYRMDQ